MEGSGFGEGPMGCSAEAPPRIIGHDEARRPSESRRIFQPQNSMPGAVLAVPGVVFCIRRQAGGLVLKGRI